MWIIESDGDTLNGKKLWLPPGKKFLFGRAKSDGTAVGFAINDGTVSRKHMTLEISTSGPNDCKNARTRSQIKVQDLGTKHGTYLNGNQIRKLISVEKDVKGETVMKNEPVKGEEYPLDQDRNEIKLGRYDSSFFITWVPIVLTFSFTSKETKANPWTDLHNQLGPLDIKVLPDYESGVTTHVVAKKRNTAKGLQALVDGKYIVHNDTFVKALIIATAADETGISLLQEDFEANFPDPLQYLPPKGDEPTQRQEVAYLPSPQRQKLFEGYTFVFYHKSQYDILMAPIAGGHGKAALMEVVPEETTINDFVGFVKKLAHEEGVGSFEDGSEGKGVVVVRFNTAKTHVEWYREFTREVALHLDHRLIEQSEFLDAVLGNDASVLRRPLEVEQSGIFAPPPSAASRAPTNIGSPQIRPDTQPALTQVSEMAPPSPPLRVRARRGARPKFTGFDDDFSGPALTSSMPESMDVDPRPAEESQWSQGLFVTQVEDPDQWNEPEPTQPPVTQPRAGQKRKASLVVEEDEVDIVDQLASNTLKFKRQRMEDEAARRRRGETTPPPKPAAEPKPKPAIKPKVPILRGRKKAEPEEDFFAPARLEREQQEDLAAAAEGNLQEQISNMSIEEMKSLAQVEEMEIVRHPRKQRPAQPDESERWEDKWNGRKNFKKFKRAPGIVSGREREKVIVQLEEVKKRDYGIGDEYWDHGDPQSKISKKKGKGKETQTQRDSLLDTQPKEKRQGKGKTATSRAAKILRGMLSDSDDDDDFGDDPISGPTPAAASSDVEIVDPPPKAAAKKKLADKTSKSQNVAPAPSPAKKRPAPAAPVAKAPPAKKQKQLAISRRREESEEESEDDMKFKLKKRK